MFVSSECCVLSGRGLCVGLVTRIEESCRLWCAESDSETSRVRRPWPTGGRRGMEIRTDKFAAIHITKAYMYI